MTDNELLQLIREMCNDAYSWNAHQVQNEKLSAPDALAAKKKMQKYSMLQYKLQQPKEGGIKCLLN